MNTLCKQYIRNVKALFPSIRKSERDYLKKLEQNLVEYCEENDFSTLEDLYKDFGTPADVINSYYSTIDMDDLCKQIQISKMIKSTLIALMISVLVATVTYCTVLYGEYQGFKQSAAFSDVPTKPHFE